jgi:hypothetical protein
LEKVVNAPAVICRAAYGDIEEADGFIPFFRIICEEGEEEDVWNRSEIGKT